MARAAVVILSLLGVTLSGCVAEEGRRRARSQESATSATPGPAPSTGEVAMAAPSYDAPIAARSRTIRVDRFETVALQPPPAEAAPVRPPRRRIVDIDLAGAPFEDVARMLADVGGFGLVVEAPGAGTVQASLRRVDAWEALVAIGHAKGLAVRYENGIAIVKAP